MVAQTLRSVHEQKLAITPPAVFPQRLAFGSGRLLQAQGEGVVFRETKQGDVVAETSIGAVRAVAHGSDGSLIALGASSGVRLEVRAKKAREFPHAAYLPDSSLFADLEEPAHFYVYYPGDQQLYRYPLETEAGAYLPIEGQFPLSGCVQPLSLLRDGAFVCRTTAGLLRKAPRGPRSEFKSGTELAPPFRLLPAKRLDELFSVSSTGEVRRLRLSAGLPEFGRFVLPAPVYAAAANEEALAFVTVSPPVPGEARRWSLLITDFNGQARFQTALATGAVSPEEDWLQAEVEDKNLAISEFEPLVAVGGGVRVVVWDYTTGNQRWAR